MNVKPPVAFTSRTGNMLRKSLLALEGAVRHLLLGKAGVPAVRFVTPLPSARETLLAPLLWMEDKFKNYFKVTSSNFFKGGLL